MVPMQVLTLEHNIGNHSKDAKADAFLYDLQLYEVERTAIAIETNAVGWHLTAILKQSDTPRKGYNANQGPVTADP